MVINYITIYQILDYTLFQVDRGLVFRFRVHRSRFDHHRLACIIFFCCRSPLNMCHSSICCSQHFQFVFITISSLPHQDLPQFGHTDYQYRPSDSSRLFLSHTRNPTIAWGWESCSCPWKISACLYWTHASYWNLFLGSAFVV